MRTFVRSMLCALWMCTALSAVARADEAQGNCQLRLATGKPGRVFSRMFRDMQSVCGAQLKLCEVESTGGLQNLSALSANRADLGFVQIDTMQDMKASDENIAALQAVLPVNANLLHVIANTAGYTSQGERSFKTLWQSETTTTPIRRFSDLKGLPVALVGSAQLLARLLDRSFALGMRFADVETEEQGVAALRAGEVAGVLSMSGWPNTTLGALPRASGITLVPFDLAIQPPHQLVRRNYPNLGIYSNVFLAAPNLLVTRPFNPAGRRGKDVAALKQCLISQLGTLQEGAFEPGWKEIKNPRDVHGWPKFGDLMSERESITSTASSGSSR